MSDGATLVKRAWPPGDLPRAGVRGSFILSCFIGLVWLAGCIGTRARHGDLQETLFAPVNVVFMGDSITSFWGPGQPGDSDAFTVHPNWINSGVYGETSGQMLARFQNDVIAQSPAMVHILAGTNDVYPGWVLCGGVQNVDTCDNIKAMVAMSRSAGIQVLLCTIPPWGPGDAAKGFDPSPDRYTRINQLNQWIEQFAADNELTIVDYHRLLVSSDGDTYVPDLTVDGIHPSPKAYTLMTPVAESAIANAQRK
jgi:lysophospholipase L1-like esterase